MLILLVHVHLCLTLHQPIYLKREKFYLGLGTGTLNQFDVLNYPKEICTFLVTGAIRSRFETKLQFGMKNCLRRGKFNTCCSFTSGEATINNRHHFNGPQARNPTDDQGSK